LIIAAPTKELTISFAKKKESVSWSSSNSVGSFDNLCGRGGTSELLLLLPFSVDRLQINDDLRRLSLCAKRDGQEPI